MYINILHFVVEYLSNKVSDFYSRSGGRFGEETITNLRHRAPFYRIFAELVSGRCGPLIRFNFVEIDHALTD